MLCGWGGNTTGLAESNGSLPPGGRLTVTCRLTACVHRDQLQAQCSVSSMGSLYLYLRHCIALKLSSHVPLLIACNAAIVFQWRYEYIYSPIKQTQTEKHRYIQKDTILDIRLGSVSVFEVAIGFLAVFFSVF